MDAKSIKVSGACITAGTERVGNFTIAFLDEDGKSEEAVFRGCPFSGCHFYHATDLVVCPTTGKSIAEEEKRQEEKRKKVSEENRAHTERHLKAQRARVAFLDDHLNGLKNNWRRYMAMPSSVLIFLLALGVYGYIIVHFRRELSSFVGIVIVCGSFAWSAYWNSRQEKYKRSIWGKADDIYDEISEPGA